MVGIYTKTLHFKVMQHIKWACTAHSHGDTISLGFCVTLEMNPLIPSACLGCSERNYLFTYGCTVETCQVKVAGKGNVPWYFHYPPGSVRLQIIPCVRTKVSAMCVSLRGA